MYINTFSRVPVNIPLCSIPQISSTPPYCCHYGIIRFCDLPGIYVKVSAAISFAQLNWILSYCLDLSIFILLLSLSPTLTQNHTRTHKRVGLWISLKHWPWFFWAKQVEAHLHVALETLQEENVWYVLGGPVMCVHVCVCMCVCLCHWGRLCTVDLSCYIFLLMLLKDITW